MRPDADRRARAARVAMACPVVEACGWRRAERRRFEVELRAVLRETRLWWGAAMCALVALSVPATAAMLDAGWPVWWVAGLLGATAALLALAALLETAPEEPLPDEGEAATARRIQAGEREGW